MKQLNITCTVSSLGQDLFSVSITADKIKLRREFYRVMTFISMMEHRVIGKKICTSVLLTFKKT